MFPAGHLSVGHLLARHHSAGLLPPENFLSLHIPAGHLPAGHLPAGYLLTGHLYARYHPGGISNWTPHR